MVGSVRAIVDAPAGRRTASERIGDFVSSVPSADVPDEVVHEVARALIDTFAVALAARNEGPSRIARDYILDSGSSGPATVWATGDRVRAEDAALVNAVMGHALDYDDVTPLAQRGHPSVVLLPPLTALGEVHASTGCQIASAYAVGYEVFTRLPQEMASDHYAHGWHTTSTFGVLAATAACAHLLRLGPERTAAAIAIAVAHVSGVLQSFGTMSKAIQPANAASAAIRSAELARRGFTGPRDSLDGPRGFMHVYGHGEDLEGPFASLGSAGFALLTTGLRVKKYPCCYGAHCAADGVLELAAREGIRHSDVESVRVTVQPRGLAPMPHKRPRSGLEGKFSLEYVVAAALIDGKLDLETFTDAAVARPEAQALLRKVDALEEDGTPPERHRARIEIALRDGRRRSVLIDRNSDRPQRVTDSEIGAKLRDCARYAGSRLDVDRFLEVVWGWRHRPIASVTDAMRF